MILSLAVSGAPVGSSHPAQAYVEGEVIVTFKPPVSLNDAQQALGNHSLALTKHFAGLSRDRGRHTGLIRARTRTTAELIAELSQDPAVETAEPNYLRWVTGAPNDTLFTNLWGLQNTGQSVNGTAGTAGDDIRFVAAWGLARPTTDQMVVAVIDTGVDYTHPDLAGNMWINSGEIAGNGVDDDGDGYVDDYYGYDFADGLPNPTDSGFHGTHVAGTIAALGNNQLGVIGVDYQARIMALRASSDGNTLPDSAIIEAIQYATMMKNRGVNIVAINESFGGEGSNSTERAAMQAAGNAGIIFCVAAGNNTNNNDTTAFYPASYRLTNMIVVAATDQNDALAYFSDYGTNTVDLAAPGVNILSTLPVSQAGTLAYVQRGSTTYAANELTYSGTTTGITATVYDCGLGNPADFPTAVRSNIALIARGTLTFSNKVANAMAAGARAAIIYNNTNGNFLGTLQVSNNWIPAVSLSQADGLALKAILPVTGTVVNTPDPTQIYQYLDGTSMATPHVSGAVAFAAMNFPSETVTQRIQRVLANVDVISGLKGKVRTGGRLNLQRIVDTDANGLPDWWELQYFGHLTGTNPNTDADHDGMSNLAEWLAGTNPTNASSCLRLMALPFKNSNAFVVSWPSVAGKYYRLERATNLLTGFNSVVQTNIAATAPTNTETDTAVLPGKARFYRVGVEP
jgi:subtilisin family serine protease